MHVHIGLIFSGLCLLAVAGLHVLADAEPTVGGLTVTGLGGLLYALAADLTLRVRHEFLLAGAGLILLAAFHVAMGTPPTVSNLIMVGAAGMLFGLAGHAWQSGRAAAFMVLFLASPVGRAATLRIPTEGIRRVVMYLIGCILFSIGVKLFLDAELGLDPLNAMIIGIVQEVNQPFIGIGSILSAVMAAFLLIWSRWNRRFPPLTTFMTMPLVGFLVDLWNYVGLDRPALALLTPGSMMLVGLILDAYATALIIMSGIGIRVIDLFAIAMVRKRGWSFFASKMSLELGFLATALLLGGPVGIATVAFLCVVVPFVPSFMWVNGSLLRLPNYGLGSTPQSV